jgi:hypothetical protein
VTLTFPSGTSPVAAQVGRDAFALQTLSGDTLSLLIPSGTSNYAVVYLCPSYIIGNIQYGEEGVWEASTADGVSFYLSCPANPINPPAGMDALTGTIDVAAISGAESFSSAAQSGNSFYAQSGYYSFTPNDLAANFDTLAPTGSDRVMLVIFDSDHDALAAKSFDNQTVPGSLSGGATVAFAAGDETTSAAITYNNVPSGFNTPQAGVGLLMGNGAGRIPTAEAETTQYPVLPADAIKSGDSYRVEASSFANGLVPPGVLAGTTSSGGPVSLTFPSPWTYAGPTPNAQPTFNFDYTGFSGKPGVIQEANYLWQAGPSGSSSYTSNQVVLSATANYGSTTLAVPDLSGLTGLLSAPASGTQVNWNAEISQYSSGLYHELPVNSTWSGVYNQGSFTVP